MIQFKRNTTGLSLIILFIFITGISFYSGAGQNPKKKTINTAIENGIQAREAYSRSMNFVKAWMNHCDMSTGLIPTNLTTSSDVWEAHNSAADNYAFMVLTAYLLDEGMYSGKMKEMLDTERRITSRINSLPDIWSFSKKGFRDESVNMDRIVFGASEYIKDGLIPLNEYIGLSPWHNRMMEMVDDLAKRFTVIRFEENPQRPKGWVEEVNGDWLQSLARIYWQTGNKKYLGWAEKIGDYYLLGGRDLTQSDYLRIRDHGCEIIGGLSELYVTLSFTNPEKKEKYKPAYYKLLDLVLEKGRNPDGLFFNAINPKTGEVTDKNVVDNWGYIFNAYYSVWMVDKTERYREAVLKGISTLNEKYRNFAWERNSHDGYADALESGINLYNREPSAPLKAWIDSEMKVMFSKQQPDGIIEGWHGDGNFARTAIMYALWKSQGARIQPWRDDVVLGAEKRGKEVYFVLESKNEWSGKLLFDSPRHKTILKMPIDYPRINQFPEWFTVEVEKEYVFRSNKKPLSGTFNARLLTDGIPLKLSPGERVEIMVKRKF
jgi:hypothetical protein